MSERGTVIRRAGRGRTGRRGFVLIAVLVVFALSMALFGLWAQAAVREHRRLAGEALRLQAVRLAEAGTARALAQRADNPQFAEETWSVPAAELDGRHAAEVRIRVTPSGAASAVRVEATAEFPAGAVRRAQITTQIEIPKTLTLPSPSGRGSTNPVPGDES